MEHTMPSTHDTKHVAQHATNTPKGWDCIEGGDEVSEPHQDEPNETFWRQARNERGMRDPQLAVETHDEQERYYTRTLRRLIGSTAMVLIAALPTMPVHAAGRTSAACQPVTVGGRTVMMKQTKSGGLSASGCGMRITLDVTDGVQDPHGFEVSGKVTDLRCTVKVTSKTLTTAGKLVEATQACVDSMHHAAERGKQ